MAKTISIFHKSAGWITAMVRELKFREYDIQENYLNEKTELCIVMGFGVVDSFLQSYVRSSNFKGRVAYVVFDIPPWRMTDEQWKHSYNQYGELLKGDCDVLTISEQTSEQIKALWGVDSEPILGFFDDKTLTPSRGNRKWNQIISISRFVPHKRFELILEAVKGTEWKVVFIGHGPGKTYYEKIAKENNINLEILESIPRSELEERLTESTVCIQPSVFEGFSIVPKEALWCNIPVILADIPINRECHGDTVDYFEPDNIESLKNTIAAKKWLDRPLAKKHIEKYRVENAMYRLETWMKNKNL